MSSEVAANFSRYMELYSLTLEVAADFWSYMQSYLLTVQNICFYYFEVGDFDMVSIN